MDISLSLPVRPEGTDTSIFIGFPLTALTFLNQQRSSPTLAPA
jgi:hypothetical protein